MACAPLSASAGLVDLSRLNRVNILMNFCTELPKKISKNYFQIFAVLEMIRLSRRFLTQHKKYGAAFLRIEDKFQKQLEEILEHYAKRSGWGTFR